jgi:myo-inositol-1-phosphate synthase
MADDPAEDGPSGSAVLKRICDDLEEFRQANKLDHVVVVHTASAEPPINGHNAHKNYKDLKKALQAKKTEILPASSLYALAAVEAGCSYFNFTPSTGIALPAILERAEEKGTLYMGRDGKTGETLLKSVLAPMFANRHLNVMSWIGHNILGNRDGEVLKDPVNKAEKLKSKDQLLRRIVGYPVDSQVSIEFVRSLSDWKVAWDFIHFQGFLNTKMSLQFTWQGSDSILAAPLVIDLARLATHEWRNGRSGCMKHLACFFKDPMDVAEQSFLAQCDLLRNHLANSGAAVELKKR